MKWGIALNVRDSISKTIDKAVIADKGGIDEIWITDFPALRYSPTVAAAIAEKTSNCRIGIGLVSPLLYSSFHIIQFMTTLIESHGDRFDLLLGPGDRYALESIGIPYTPKSIVQETKNSLKHVKNSLLESGHACRVLLGAQGPKMIEISLGADGVLLNYSDIEMAKWAANQIHDKKADDFQLGLFPPTYIGPCEKFSDNQMISYSAAMVAIGLGRTVAELFNLSTTLTVARELLKERGEIDNEVVAALGDDILKRFAFCGTPDQLREYVKNLKKIGYTSVVFGPPIGLSKKSVEHLISIASSDQYYSNSGR